MNSELTSYKLDAFWILFMGHISWFMADISHKHLLLKYRWYDEFWCEESQVLKSVGCLRTAGFTAHHHKGADEQHTVQRQQQQQVDHHK